MIVSETEAGSTMVTEADGADLFVPFGMRILVHDGRYFLVPKGITAGDLADPFVQSNPRIKSATTLECLLSKPVEDGEIKAIEFAGWMPQFELFGNCGNHPQFLSSLRTPPDGWEFVQSPPFRALQPEVVWDKDFWRLLRRIDYLFGLSSVLRGRNDLMRVTTAYRQSGYTVFRHLDEYFAIPKELCPSAEFRDNIQELKHPAVLTSSDLPSILRQIERQVPNLDFGANPGRPVAVFNTYYGLNIIVFQYRQIYFVWSNAWGPFSAGDFEVCRFTRLLEQFVDSELQNPRPPSRWEWAGATASLAVRSVINGARPSVILEFIASRKPDVSRRFATRARGVFIPSVPYIIGPTKWIIEVEDSTTLFFPYAHNGRTAETNLRELPVFPAVKALLEQPQCHAVLTHIRSTADTMRSLFRSARIEGKIAYCPLGFTATSVIPQRRMKKADEPVHVLFTSSWHQDQVGFFVRGGIDALEAFDLAAQRDDRLHLTIRCVIPSGQCHDRFLELQNKYGQHRIRNENKYLVPEEWRDLLLSSDIFILPAARIHVVSLLEAMAHGLAVLTSDGWAIEEYVTDRENALVVRGRSGKTSWIDPAAGMLREDYSSMYTPNPAIIGQLVRYLEVLSNDPEFRWKLGRAAQETVSMKFTLERWNAALRKLFETL
jgi:glycosyltransferase involved in cell wall biosynthesis